jgi:site-specific DNA-methyltransferase (adenine-specific)
LIWNQQFQEYDEAYESSKYRHVDEATGKLYRLSDMTGAGVRQGDSGKAWKHYNPTSIGRHWQPPSYCYWKYEQITGEDLAQYPLLERLDELDRIGLVHWPNKEMVGPSTNSFSTTWRV